MFFLVGRVLGKRRQGLFGPTPSGVGGEEGLEFGYCFDVSCSVPFVSRVAAHPSQVSIRAYLPIWAFLYILQFLFLPLIVPDFTVSNFFGNTMYLAAFSYYFVITFLGYNGKLIAASTPLYWRCSLVSSSPFPEQDRDITLTNTSLGSDLVHQSLYIRLRDAFRTCALVRSCCTRRLNYNTCIASHGTALSGVHSFTD